MKNVPALCSDVIMTRCDHFKFHLHFLLDPANLLLTWPLRRGIFLVSRSNASGKLNCEFSHQ